MSHGEIKEEEEDRDHSEEKDGGTSEEEDEREWYNGRKGSGNQRPSAAARQHLEFNTNTSASSAVYHSSVSAESNTTLVDIATSGLELR